jgi:hypothetical protein
MSPCMPRSIVFAAALIGAAHATSAAPLAGQRELLQRYVAPTALSYRAEIALGQSSPSVAQAGALEFARSNALAGRVLVVQDGALSLVPPVPMVAVSQSGDLETLLKNYSTEWGQRAANASAGVLSAQRIAERSTQRVRFVPHDGWRYTRVLWLDEQTGLPLRTETYRKDELIEQMQVKSIVFAQTDPQPRSAAAKSAVFYVRNVPAGFALVSVLGDQSRAQQIYSDGLARVSVFVQSAGHLPGTGFSQRGSTGFVVRRTGNVDLVAVGDVPQATLERFLSGMDAAE